MVACPCSDAWFSTGPGFPRKLPKKLSPFCPKMCIGWPKPILKP